MGAFDTYNDSPNAINNEGQEISLKFEKTSETTGRVSWNIPSPPQGCASDNQAYNGIIITLDTTHTNVKKSPIDGTVYESDNTVDRDLHAGDRIDTSLVLGDFYNDKTTTFLDLTGLLPNESYYISGYAVDKQNRYHSQGVHAYSLGLSSGNKSEDTAGCQKVIISENNISPSDPTNLTLNYTYDFQFDYDVEDLTRFKNQSGIITTFNQPSGTYSGGIDFKTIAINGSTSQTYQELLDTINLELKKLNNPFIGNVPPNTNAYYWNNPELFLWDGFQHLKQDVIVEDTDPTIRAIGDLWYDQILLKQWDGALWNVKEYIDYYKDPSDLHCTDYWFNGTNAYNHDGNVWCTVNQYIQTIDPVALPVIECGSFWYDENTQLINKLSNESEWIQTNVIYWAQDPNSLVVGTLWFNDVLQELKEWNGITFDSLSISISDIEPVSPINNQYWFDPINNVFTKYNSTTSTWDIIIVLVFGEDPTVRESCEIWWDSSTNNLYIWDIITTSWSLVSLIESAINPLLAAIIPTDSIWINTATIEGFKWDGVQWNSVNLINYSVDPTNRIIGDIWFDNVNKVWSTWDGTQWNVNDVIESLIEPTAATLPLNTLWYDLTNNTLQLWNGLSWLPISFSTSPITPTNGTLWLNSTDNTLNEWFKNSWNEIEADVSVILENNCLNFCSKTLGHSSNVLLNPITDNLFQFLEPNIPSTYSLVLEGSDGVSSDPMYAQIGVGTDGSPDERRELADSIRHQLGYPTVEVELTKQQLDYCIDAAIEEIRKRSSSGYKRGYFFLDMLPNQQRYILSNSGNGFNKIVSIQAIYRTTSSFLHGFDNGVFGQTAINFLYNAQGYDLVSYHLYSSYIEELENLFATKILYQWNEQTRALDILQSGYRNERVLLDVSVERTEQDLISDRYLKPWIEGWALAQSMILLSQIRGKYASLPGANGISLNAQDLYQQAQDLMITLSAEIDDYVIDDPTEFGMGSTFILG